MRKEITDEDVAAALERSTTRWQMNDRLITGLTLRAGRSTAGWLVCTTTGTIIRKKFGDPATMSLEVARLIAQEALLHHRAGGDIDEDWIAAAQARHGILAEEAPAYIEPPAPWTWRDGVEAFLHFQEKQGRAELTIVNTRKGLVKYLGALNDKLIRDLDLEDVEDAVAELQRRTPGNVPLAVKSAKPLSRWLSSGDRPAKSGQTEHFLSRLEIPESTTKASASITSLTPPRIEDVAYLVAVCRSGLLEDSAARALEVIVLTGLRRTAVVSARKKDVRDAYWTIPAAALKRKVSLRVMMTKRLRELLTSDDPVWVFPQPRKSFSGERSHLDASSIGRAIWEIPEAPTTTQITASRRRYFEESGDDIVLLHSLNLLTDAGAADEDGGDNKIYDGRPAWDLRHSIIESWSDAIEKAMEDVELDVDAVRAAIRAKRPNKDV